MNSCNKSKKKMFSLIAAKTQGMHQGAVSIVGLARRHDKLPEIFL